MKVSHFALCAALAAISLISPNSPANATDRLSLGVGYYDVSDDQEAADFRLEYRFEDNVLWEIKPFLGLEVTSDEAAYALGGFYYDWTVAPQWIVTPSLAAGAYHDGDGKDLGHTLEFRSQLEVAYEFQGQDRLSLGFGHISNASLGDKNPGTEILSLYYHVPASRIFGE